MNYLDIDNRHEERALPGLETMLVIVIGFIGILIYFACVVK